jgi:hypothetical protein
VEAYQGSLRMGDDRAILALQPAIDHRLKGGSSWLSVARAKGGAPAP